MSMVDVLTKLQKKLGLTMYGLGKKLGLKSTSHIWQLKTGRKKAGLRTIKKIIKLGEEVGMNITLEMLED